MGTPSPSLHVQSLMIKREREREREKWILHPRGNREERGRNGQGQTHSFTFFFSLSPFFHSEHGRSTRATKSVLVECKKADRMSHPTTTRVACKKKGKLGQNTYTLHTRLFFWARFAADLRAQSALNNKNFRRRSSGEKFAKTALLGLVGWAQLLLLQKVGLPNCKSGRPSSQAPEVVRAVQKLLRAKKVLVYFFFLPGTRSQAWNFFFVLGRGGMQDRIQVFFFLKGGGNSSPPKPNQCWHH